MPKKWTPEDEAYLVANYDKIAIDDLAEQFGVTKKAVRVKYGKLRDRPDFESIAKHAPETPPIPVQGTQPRGPRKWSEDDERYLLANYNSMSLEELASHFGVTKKAVRVKYGKIKHKAADLVPDKGVSEVEQLQVGPKRWTEEDEAYLIGHYEELGEDAMAEHFGISRKMVRERYGKLRNRPRSMIQVPRHRIPQTKSGAPQRPKRDPVVPLVSMSMPRKFQRKEDDGEKTKGTEKTHLMIMTEDGWKPLNLHRKRITT
ncbi:hypothetical protein K8I28_10360 [bacterium]|nr:hypothetical protein [bacterium]